MDRDTLRLYLIFAGVILVIGIIAWDRICKWKKQQPPDPDPGLVQENTSEFAPVSMNASDDPIPDNDLDLPSMHADTEFGEADALQLPDDELKQTPNTVSAEQEDDEPLELVQLYVVAREEFQFPGNALVDALESAGMEYGEMNIFHRNLGANRLPAYSAVNIVEPGIFPLDSLDSFTTPGIALFLQASQVDHPLEVLDEMLGTARTLAARLGGSVLDESRDELSVEKTELLRDRIGNRD